MPDGLDDASADYARRHGLLCARIRATPFQVTVACLLAVLAATPLLISPQAGWVTVSVVIAVVSAAPLALRLLAAALACHRDPTLVVSAEAIAALDRATLPTYTVLVPLYREAEVVDDLLAALDGLDYPRDRLDIQILVEHDDDITTAALAARALPPCVRITTAPPGQPRTKPRACNVGLARSSADLLVIFDAEDRPEPDQLLKAVAAYRNLPPEVVCLQGRLDHYNSRQSLCARWTAIDYLLWFRLVLPGLQRLGAPLPLGGTSNHFRVEALRQLGGWDPFNVTEDCDLGLRIARRGWTTRMLATTTWEEAVARPRAWIRQRSRWLKGYCQTWLVHSRPVCGRGGFRPWEFACLSLNTIGLLAALVVNPVAWIVLALWLVFGWSVVDPHDPLSVTTLVIGAAGLAANVLVVIGAAWACRRLGRRDLFAAALLSPVAWALQSLAAWQACWELVARPFHWQKTVHGQAVADGAPPMRNGGHRLAVVAAMLIFAIAGLAAWRVADDLATQERARRGEIPRQLALPLFTGEVTSLIDASPRPRPAPWRTAAGDGRPDRGIDGPALAADVAFPGSALDLVNGRRRDWSGMAALACDLHVAADAPRHLRVAAHLRDGDLRWFQSESPQRLIPGTWTAVAFDLRDAAQWTGVDHLRDFSAELLAELREVGLHIRGHEDWQGTVTVANLRVIAAEDVIPRADIRSAPTTATRMQAWDLACTLSKAWPNPFDPDVVAIDARIIQADGSEVLVPAFLDQTYRRNRTGPGERLEATGAPFWHVRWRPRQAGAHRWSLELREGGGEPQVLASGDLVVADAPARGYLTRSAAKPDLFAWEDGSFFYPIGQNVCQAVDHVPPVKRWSFPEPTDEGTFTFDRYFARMADAGMNAARVWMTPWSHGIEGRADWEGFRGAGRYNLAQAWKVDRLLDEGERLGIGLILTLHHMSEFNSAWLSRAWKDSALNAVHGGPLRDPEDFYTDPEVRRLYHQRVRYLVARWGSHPALLAWELFGEANLMPGCDFGGPVPESCVAWHRDLEQRIRDLDHGRHLVFTHCHNWQAGHELWKLDGIDCVQGNGYIRPPNVSSDHVVNFDRYLAEVAHYRKPVLVAEFGGRSELGAPSEDYLVGQLHSGIWASFVRPFAGTALHWWWNLVDGRDLYPHYAGLARFAQGIDRLERDYRAVQPRVQGGKVQAAGMQDDQGGFYWIYDPRLFVEWADIDPVAGGTLHLDGLTPGRYRLERWDTLGGLTASEEVVVGSDGADLALPTIHRDLALRLELLP